MSDVKDAAENGSYVCSGLAISCLPCCRAELTLTPATTELLFEYDLKMNRLRWGQNRRPQPVTTIAITSTVMKRTTTNKCMWFEQKQQ
jgi:hypothetical protein